MSLKGNARAKVLLNGKVNGAEVIYMDTYMIAVMNGYEGTIEEWLASLKGEKGDKGDSGTPNDNEIGADTWSSRKIVETLCPPINEAGYLVQCCPLDGTELLVTWDEDVVGEVHVCGKNLYDKEAYPLTENQLIRYASGTYATSKTFAATEKYIPCAHLQGQTISIRHAPRITENNNNTGGGIAFYDSNQAYLSGANTSQVAVPDDAAYLRFCINMDYDHEAQIELGADVTEYAPYVGKINHVDGVLMEGIVTPINGLNTIWVTDGGGEAYHGTVTGFADPNAEIKRLKARVDALEKG